MGKSNKRDQYFNTHIRNQPTATSYLQALFLSPYNTHKRIAIALQELHAQLIEEEGLTMNGEQIEHS